MKVSDMRKVLEKLPDDLDIAVGLEDELYDIASAEEGEFVDDAGGSPTPLLILVLEDDQGGDDDNSEGDDDDQDDEQTH